MTTPILNDAATAAANGTADIAQRDLLRDACADAYAKRLKAPDAVWSVVGVGGSIIVVLLLVFSVFLSGFAEDRARIALLEQPTTVNLSISQRGDPHQNLKVTADDLPEGLTGLEKTIIRGWALESSVCSDRSGSSTWNPPGLQASAKIEHKLFSPDLRVKMVLKSPGRTVVVRFDKVCEKAENS